jgi:hypothetical protein
MLLPAGDRRERAAATDVPKASKFVTKPGDGLPVEDGCRPEVFASNLPFEERFHEGCDTQDRCYGKLVLFLLGQVVIDKQRSWQVS